MIKYNNSNIRGGDIPEQEPLPMPKRPSRGELFGGPDGMPYEVKKNLGLGVRSKPVELPPLYDPLKNIKDK